MGSREIFREDGVFDFIFIRFFVHMHECMVRVCSVSQEHMCVLTEARGLQMSCSTTLHLIPLRRVLSWDLEPGWQPVSTRFPTASALHSAGAPAMHVWPWLAFHIGVGGFNSDPHT